MKLKKEMLKSVNSDCVCYEELMNRCAAIIDRVMPDKFPQYCDAIRAIAYFIECMDKSELQEEFPRIRQFMIDLADTADMIKKKGVYDLTTRS